MRALGRIGVVVCLVAGSAALISCKKEPPVRAADSAAPPSSTPTSQGNTPTVPALMKEHFTRAADMKAAVIRGDLDAFKKSALWLAEHQMNGDLPATWKAHLQGMQNAARAGRDAVDLEAAAAALGATGRACAACHEQLGKPSIEVGSPPGEGSGAQLHMVRHQWAADRMWEGLMAPSGDAWIKGSEVLADAPLHREPLAGPRSVSARVSALAKDVHDLGHRGRTIDAKERGNIYGAFIATCAACHSELSVKTD